MTNYLEVKESERLMMRPLSIEDAEVWEEYVKDRQVKFPPSYGDSVSKISTTWIKHQLKRYEEGRFGLMALICKNSGKYIGQAGLISQNVNEIEELEIGYHLLPKHRGKGYAIEAAKKFREIGFDIEHAQSLISIIKPDNKASQKVALRNGMIETSSATFRGETVLIFRIIRKAYEELINQV